MHSAAAVALKCCCGLLATRNSFLTEEHLLLPDQETKGFLINESEFHRHKWNQCIWLHGHFGHQIPLLAMPFIMGGCHCHGRHSAFLRHDHLKKFVHYRVNAKHQQHNRLHPLPPFGKCLLHPLKVESIHLNLSPPPSIKGIQNLP